MTRSRRNEKNLEASSTVHQLPPVADGVLADHRAAADLGQRARGAVREGGGDAARRVIYADSGLMAYAEGQTDETDLMPYDVLDAIIELYMENDRSPAEIVAKGFDAADVDKVVYERLLNATTWNHLEVMQDLRLDDVDKVGGEGLHSSSKGAKIRISKGRTTYASTMATSMLPAQKPMMFRGPTSRIFRSSSSTRPAVYSLTSCPAGRSRYS